jgi:hypothetical protein
LLNLEHPDGGAKAVWFHSLGYARDQWQLLVEDLLAIEFDPETTRFGIKYRAAGSVRRPNHRPRYPDQNQRVPVASLERFRPGWWPRNE